MGFGAQKRGQGQRGKTERLCVALHKVKEEEEVTYRENVQKEERRELWGELLNGTVQERRSDQERRLGKKWMMHRFICKRP